MERELHDRMVTDDAKEVLAGDYVAKLKPDTDRVVKYDVLVPGLKALVDQGVIPQEEADKACHTPAPKPPEPKADFRYLPKLARYGSAAQELIEKSVVETESTKLVIEERKRPAKNVTGRICEVDECVDTREAVA